MFFKRESPLPHPVPDSAHKHPLLPVDSILPSHATTAAAVNSPTTSPSPDCPHDKQSDCRALGIFAGAGDSPRLLAQGARAAGRRIIGIGFRGAEEKEFIELCDQYRAFRVGAIAAPRRFMRQHQVKEAIFAGQIKPSCIYTLWPDKDARALLGGLEQRNAHSIFGAICDYCARAGIHILPSTRYMEHAMPPAGQIAGPTPTPDILDAAALGMQNALEIARLDIGQSIIMQGRHVQCIEAYKGTNECIAAAAWLPPHSNQASPSAEKNEEKILCKITKPGHDMRFDVPCIGMTTLINCQRAGIRYIAIEANKTIILQAKQVREYCQQEQISLFALDTQALPVWCAHAQTRGKSQNEHHAVLQQPSAKEAHLHGDALIAQQLASELQRLGISESAIICEGVIIAVGDRQGPLKCIQRAHKYMKGLRLARIFSRIYHFLRGQGYSPPPTPCMVSLIPLDEQCQQAAQKAGIRIIHWR